MGLLADVHAIAEADAAIAATLKAMLAELSLIRQALEKFSGTEVSGISVTHSPPASN